MKYYFMLYLVIMQNKTITNLTVGPIATNCWIYPFGEKDSLVIDPGDEADMIISTLKNLALFPAYILLTHGHFDHIAAIPQLVQTFSAKIMIAIHKFDAEYLGPDAYKTHAVSAKAAIGDTSLIDTLFTDNKKLPVADILLEEGSIVGPFTVLHLPGHTQGSVAFWDREEKVLFTGDTLFMDAYGRTDLPGGNRNDMLTSLRRLFTMDSNITVYPGHGNITTI